MNQISFAGRNLLSFITFNIGWWACTLGASYGYEWVGPALAPFGILLHLYYSPARLGESLFIAACGLLGFALDSTLIRLNLFTVVPATDYAPLWLVAIWALLGITMESMLMLRQRPWMLALIGGATGPLSYFPGEALNILYYSRPLWLVLAIHGLIWAILTPALFKLREFCLVAAGSWQNR